MKKIHYYTLASRPYSVNSAPFDCLSEVKTHDQLRYEVLGYSRKLSPLEMNQFELYAIDREFVEGQARQSAEELRCAINELSRDEVEEYILSGRESFHLKIHPLRVKLYLEIFWTLIEKRTV